jgi:hypothetical protein
VTQELSVHFNGLSGGQVIKVGQSLAEALQSPAPHLYGKFLGQLVIA